MAWSKTTGTVVLSCTYNSKLEIARQCSPSLYNCYGQTLHDEGKERKKLEHIWGNIKIPFKIISAAKCGSPYDSYHRNFSLTDKLKDISLSKPKVKIGGADFVSDQNWFLAPIFPYENGDKKYAIQVKTY